MLDCLGVVCVNFEGGLCGVHSSGLLSNLGLEEVTLWVLVASQVWASRIWALSMCILHFEDSLLDYSAVVSVEFRGWVTLFAVFLSFFLLFRLDPRIARD